RPTAAAAYRHLLEGADGGDGDPEGPRDQVGNPTQLTTILVAPWQQEEHVSQAVQAPLCELAQQPRRDLEVHRRQGKGQGPGPGRDGEDPGLGACALSARLSLRFPFRRRCLLGGGPGSDSGRGLPRLRRSRSTRVRSEEHTYEHQSREISVCSIMT